MPISQPQLEAVMIKFLSDFSTSGDTITRDTIHSSVLSDEGIGTATSKRIYKSLVRFTIIRNGGADKAWPPNWMDLSVAELAARLL